MSQLLSTLAHTIKLARFEALVEAKILADLTTRLVGGPDAGVDRCGSFGGVVETFDGDY